MKTTKSIAAYAMLLGTLLATNLVETAHAGAGRTGGKSSPKIAHGMRKNVVRTRNAGPIGVTISNIETDAGMRSDVGDCLDAGASDMRRAVLRYEIELAFERGDFGLAFKLLDDIDNDCD